MSLWTPEKGNSQERLNKLELEVQKLHAVLNVYGSLFEINRRFFEEINRTIGSNNPPQDKSKDQVASSPPLQGDSK